MERLTESELSLVEIAVSRDLARRWRKNGHQELAKELVGVRKGVLRKLKDRKE